MLIENLAATITEKPFEYNWSKVLDDKATVVYHSNIPHFSYVTSQILFENYENNELIHGNTKHTVLHFAVNPSEDEMGDENKLIQFIKDYLHEIGYDNQPTIIFRHNDIDRQHYHVLCPRVLKTGKVILNNYDGTNWERLKNQEIVEDLCEKYGFNSAYSQKGKIKEPSETTKNRLRLYANSKDKKADAVYLYKEALKFNFATFSDFENVLFAMRLMLRRYEKRNGKGTGVSLRGIKPTGEIFSGPLKIEKHLKGQAYEMYMAAQGKNNHRTDDDVYGEIMMKSTIDWSMLHAVHADSFRDLMSQYGYFVVIKREGEDKFKPITDGATAGKILDVCIVDRKRRRVYSGERLMSIWDYNQIKAKEQSMIWEPVHHKVDEKTWKTATKEDTAWIQALLERRWEEYNSLPIDRVYKGRGR